MGVLKFYKPMQAVYEAIMYGTSEYITGNLTYRGNLMRQRYCDVIQNTSLDGYIYTDDTLTTIATSGNKNLKYPCSYAMSSYPSAIYGYWRPFYFNISGNYESINGLNGTSNTTHDLSRSDLSNKVADCLPQSSISQDGSLQLSIILTNNGSESTVVKAIERTRKYYFAADNNSGTSSSGFFLAWAYYLDEEDWVELEPGESKLITIKITINDLTQ